MLNRKPKKKKKFEGCMWCLSSNICRSLGRHRSHKLVTPAARWAVQCGLSTTAAVARAKARAKMDDGSASEYGRMTKDALIRRIKALEYELRAKDRQQQGAPAATSTSTEGETATTTTTANSSSKQGGRAEPGQELESEPETKAKANAETEPEPPKKKKKVRRGVDPSKYSTRLIALKLSYLGKNYGGFEYQPTTKVPTIEEELWKAMVKGCLIFPENPDLVNWDSIEYSKCGRTDRGVSAFGQVIGVRVRSNRPLPKPPGEAPAGTSIGSGDGDGESAAETTEKPPAREFNDLVDELPYPRLLNRLLPPDIRILAWCPTPPADFSARHHCRERQYRYYFTQPAYSPRPRSLEDPKRQDGNGNGKRPRDGWLDIDAMRAAAKKFEGLHDFRNFCKIDGGKPQLTFTRRIFESDIVEVPDIETALPYLQHDDFWPPSPPSPSEPSTTASPPPLQENFPKVYYFHVRGSAFLWHQIRCMVAVLFVVGQGLEDASVVDRLLDVAAEPRRPAYVMAHETPLVLWDCVFPRDLDDPDPARRVDDGLDWVRVGEQCALHAHGGTGLVDHLWRGWRESKTDEILAGQLLSAVAGRADLGRRADPSAPRYAPAAQTVFKGGESERSEGTYVPLLQKPRLPSPQEAFDKEAKRRGYESAAHVLEVMAQRRAEAAAAAAVGDAEVIQTQTQTQTQTHAVGGEAAG
ncbi:pseudouridine synthase [Nemania sp. NC0429]|nr:pseudouridine synthase [Nemania sp. NC0429]